MSMTIDFLTDYCNENVNIDMTNKTVIGYTISEINAGSIRINFNIENEYYITDIVELLSFSYMKTKN